MESHLPNTGLNAAGHQQRIMFSNLFKHWHTLVKSDATNADFHVTSWSLDKC